MKFTAQVLLFDIMQVNNTPRTFFVKYCTRKAQVSSNFISSTPGGKYKPFTEEEN